jgi:hypothetical protein
VSYPVEFFYALFLMAMIQTKRFAVFLEVNDKIKAYHMLFYMPFLLVYHYWA